MDLLRFGMMTVRAAVDARRAFLSLVGFLAVLFLAALLFTGAPAVAQAGGDAGADGARHIAMTLVAETDRPAPGGTVMVAIAAVPERGWHGYWLNPGDAGVAPSANWTLPGGATADPLRYPVPRHLMVAGLMNYVYEGPYALLATVHVPRGMAVGTALPVAVRLDYLVCSDSLCVPETAELSLALTVGDGRVPPESRARFDAWRRALPAPVTTDGTWQRAGDRFRLSLPIPAGAAAGDVYFFPLTDGVLEYAAPQRVARSGDRLFIETQARDGAPADASVEGVLALGNERGLDVRAAPGTVIMPDTGPDTGPDAVGSVPGAVADGTGGAIAGAVLVAFAGAVLGGLLLNIMPCVFPILSLKALSLARAGEDERHARREALAYAAGVLVMCLALGGLLLGLRAGGAALGWAFQLQEPRVILLLLLLVTAIAFNLAGLFELSAPGFAGCVAGNGLGSAFATGVLAAFIATPCTGPFMGAALGAALALPWAGAMAVFAGLGLGIALPFLLIGFVPALRRRLPRPGAWMERVRQILSVPMFVTALALAWVLGRQAGVNGMALGMAAALVLALALWWVGMRQRGGRTRAWLPALPLLLAALASVALAHPAPVAREQENVSATAAEPFSPARLQALRDEGRPVFAYFTADWCITCKVNERAAIDTDATRAAFRAGNVAVLVGDWTNGDPELGRFLEAHGRAGVPLYLYYAPGEEQPRVLPQILTPALLAQLSAGPDGE